MLDLNGIKSKCFILVMSLALLLGATSCSNEEFEDNIPDQPKELSKAELIDAALSRMPQTRANAPFPVVMITTRTTVSVSCTATEAVVIHWGDNETTSIPKGDLSNHTHTYSDNQPSHGIFLEGSNEAITHLDVYLNGLIYLDIINNTGLEYLECAWNQLEQLDLTGCSKLKQISASSNNLSSINVTYSPDLGELLLNHNQLTSIDVSKNPNLYDLGLAGNPITDLDLSKNRDLWYLSLSSPSINSINNLPISSTSFTIFPKLKFLDIPYTLYFFRFIK